MNFQASSINFRGEFYVFVCVVFGDVGDVVSKAWCVCISVGLCVCIRVFFVCVCVCVLKA